MKIAVAVALSLMSLTSLQAFAGKPCDELKSEIAAKLDAKGVAGYTLEAVPNDQVGEQKVVGSCEGGTKKIIYARGGAAAATPAAPTEAAAQ